MRRSRAFTLVELLVVIAILALLVTMLMPMLARAKEIARRTLCMTSQKNVGWAALMFAQDHNGRGPGRAHRFKPTGSSISWANILNYQQYGEEVLQRMGNEPKEKMLYCPSMKPWGNNRYARAWKWNMYAAGGPGWGGNLPCGPYGDMAPDPAVINASWDSYGFGAVLEAFPNAGYQFLMCEGERASDEIFSSRKSPPYEVELGTDPSYAPYSSKGGGWAFRHVGTTANFLFIDGHVKTYGPDEHIDEKARYAYVLD
jgi:prepilin-type N-terminal cleavage/methylation domain-containing protein/prepilin-type processing-associated H-X9-DG protein